MEQLQENAIDAVGQARRMYRRVLAGWAQDVLLIRARGLEQPGWPPSSPIGEFVIALPGPRRRGLGSQAA